QGICATEARAPIDADALGRGARVEAARAERLRHGAERELGRTIEVGRLAFLQHLRRLPIDHGADLPARALPDPARQPADAGSSACASSENSLPARSLMRASVSIGAHYKPL